MLRFLRSCRWAQTLCAVILLDWLISTVLLARGTIMEWNPLFAWLWSLGPIVFHSTKAGLTGIGLYLLSVSYRSVPQLTCGVARWLVVVYCCVWCISLLLLCYWTLSV